MKELISLNFGLSDFLLLSPFHMKMYFICWQTILRNFGDDVLFVLHLGGSQLPRLYPTSTSKHLRVVDLLVGDFLSFAHSLILFDIIIDLLYRKNSVRKLFLFGLWCSLMVEKQWRFELSILKKSWKRAATRSIPQINSLQKTQKNGK